MSDKKRKADTIQGGIGVLESASVSGRCYKYGMEEYRKYFNSFNAFDRHKILINQYLLYHPGSVSLLKRDTTRDKRDIDILRENHRFIWEENAVIESWGKKIAKKYYDKLFKEYCICDLSRYKTGQVGMRWRTEAEVIDGKGQFTCGEKHCPEKENLRTWEMNFGYIEEGVKKNALVKLRLCHDCSYKINYKHKRKEIKKLKKQKYIDKTTHKRVKLNDDVENVSDEDSNAGDEKVEVAPATVATEDIWKEPAKVEEKDREEEFEEYLQDLFL
ncbi:UNVERIFIED_CONTAM: hypothetical protein RMT77_011838 [Armadillidium vulgare]